MSRSTSGELILTQPVLPDSGRTAQLVDHSIEFRDVSFSYTDRPR